jgi:hypothetical protein
LGGKVGLERVSGWIGEARLYDHLHIPKSERKSNNTEKRRESNPVKEKKTRSENQGVTNLPPLRKSRPRDFRAYLPIKGDLPVCDLDPSAVLSLSVYWPFNCLF